MLLDQIIERENKFLNELSKCSNSGFQTYLFGAGGGANTVENKANIINFKFAGKLVNKKYFNSKDYEVCLEDFLDNNTTKVNIVIAFKGYNEGMLKQWEDKINIIIDLDIWAGNYDVDPSFLTYDFVKENINKLDNIYSELADDYSRKVLVAYINQKISTDYKYLSHVMTQPQYFEEIMPLTSDEVFLDCGAYDGDSAISFVNVLKRRGINKYKKIIAIEPDPYNFKKLEQRNITNIEPINKATSDKKDTLHFTTDNTSSMICRGGGITVETDKIDDLIKEKVTLIKMDIEGAELSSLKGAEQTIRNYKPKLAICIYHKKEDLWEIQEYLKTLIPTYKFYIRAYEKTATELVLYAIP